MNKPAAAKPRNGLASLLWVAPLRMCLLLACLLVGRAALAQTVYYVKTGGSDANIGTSWAQAFKTLQKALATANNAQIWVAQGTYYPDEGPGHTNNSRSEAFSMKNNLAIYGGFAGTETQLGLRDWKANVTILSGDIDQVAGNAGNAYTVVNNDDGNLTNTAVLDGFTITGGYNSEDLGGGMFNYLSSPTLTNCTFSGNSSDYGGGMYNIESRPVLTNCIFLGNGASYGGGMYNRDFSSPQLINCSFLGNRAGADGGGMYNEFYSSPKLTNCSFSGNKADDGGGMYNYGSMPTLTNCIFWGDGNSEILSNDGGATVSNSIVQGGYDGTGNLNQDPLFVSQPNYLQAPATAGNLRLQPCSPAIDAGSDAANTTATDLDGKPRKVDAVAGGSVIDMGAYEYQGSTTNVVLYVSAGAPAGGSGASWATAFNDLQDALRVAGNCSNVKQIWVAAGTYKPTATNVRSLSFVMKNNLAIYGGFAGTETSLSQRNWKTNVTILSGDIGTAGNGDNSLHVVYNNNLNNTAVLDGFTVTGGNAGGATDEQKSGGGMYNNSSSPILANCIFSGNTATYYGGGMYNTSSSPVLINCIFSGNTAPSNSGGGMYNGSSSSPVLTNCTFSGNAAYFGGGMYNDGSLPTLTNCILWGNGIIGIFDGYGNSNISYSIIQGGYPGTGNLNQDPLFVSTTDLHLRTCSPAIDAGSDAANTTATDLDGNSRKVDAINGGGQIDMGAYEFQNGLPEINVQGNGVSIVDGDNTPSPADHTDFGNVNTGAGLQRTFTVQNTGAGSLTISGITLSGANAGMFTVGALTPSSPVAPNSSATFTITFAPPSTGLKTATVNIAGNDCDEAAYDFAVQGTGVAAGPVTYYPRTSATDLGQVSNWTDAVSGSGGTSPSNFTSPNQLFNVNTNVAAPTVNSAWTISGGSNLVLNNTAALTFNPAVSLTVGTGSVADFNGRPVVLKSTAAGTAFIGQITGTLSGATNVTVERYIPARRAWRILSAPVAGSQTINGAWQEGAASTASNPVPNYGTFITGGPVAAGFDQSPGASSSIKTYNSSVNNWVAVPNTNATPVNVNAYMTFVYGNRNSNTIAVGAVPTNTTLRATGALRTGDQPFSVSATGFTAIPNPFASPINFGTITRTNVANNFYLWDPRVGGPNGVGGYVTVSWNGSSYDVSSNAISAESQYIQSGQGFLVSATAAGASLIIKESDKVSLGSDDVFRTTAGAIANTPVFSDPSKGQGLRVSLHTVNEEGSTAWLDEAFCSYKTTYADKVDNLDAVKATNMKENLGIAREGRTLTIERRGLPTEGDTINLRLWNTEQKRYLLQVNAVNLEAMGLFAYLEDKHLRTMTPISLTEVAQVSFSITSDAASARADRFRFILTKNGKPAAADRVTKSGFTAYPNPLTGTVLNVQFTNQPSGTYRLSVLNSTGQVVWESTVQHPGGTSLQRLALEKPLAAGLYQLQVSGVSTTTLRIVSYQ